MDGAGELKELIEQHVQELIDTGKARRRVRPVLVYDSDENSLAGRDYHWEWREVLSDRVETNEPPKPEEPPGPLRIVSPRAVDDWDPI